MAATELELAMLELVRKSHCGHIDSTDPNHRCIGQCTITRAGCELKCSLCGPGHTFTPDDLEAKQAVGAILKAVGINMYRLSDEAIVSAIGAWDNLLRARKRQWETETRPVPGDLVCTETRPDPEDLVCPGCPHPRSHHAQVGSAVGCLTTIGETGYCHCHLACDGKDYRQVEEPPTPPTPPTAPEPDAEDIPF